MLGTAAAAAGWLPHGCTGPMSDPSLLPIHDSRLSQPLPISILFLAHTPLPFHSFLPHIPKGANAPSVNNCQRGKLFFVFPRRACPQPHLNRTHPALLLYLPFYFIFPPPTPHPEFFSRQAVHRHFTGKRTEQRHPSSVRACLWLCSGLPLKDHKELSLPACVVRTKPQPNPSSR